jgi:hypothetical protein
MRIAVMIECVGPLWNSSMPRIMSVSGIMESTRIAGMFRFSLSGFAVVLAMN